MIFSPQNVFSSAFSDVGAGFAVRANAWHYPEMVIYSQYTQRALVAHHRREFAVRKRLFGEGTLYDRIVTQEDIAAASRISVFPESRSCYPLCGKTPTPERLSPSTVNIRNF